MPALYLLFESSSGYALFERTKSEELELSQAQRDIVDLGKFSEIVKLKAENALENINAISEGEATQFLLDWLELSLPRPPKSSSAPPAYQLGVLDPRLGGAIKDSLGVPCISSKLSDELLRGCRLHLLHYLKSLSAADLHQSQLGLSHAYSRSKVKFNVHRVDNMIIQSSALLDQLDKDINTFAMRCREWYSWHFPELVGIVNDNILFAQCCGLIGNKSSLSPARLPELEAVLQDKQKAKAVLEAAKMSMGTDISPIDLINIEQFAARVVQLGLYRRQLHAYLTSKMNLCAPNLSALIGEQVGARLISHAGSLTNLAKYPASTVQILGAEKALFRALKTKCFPADDHEILTACGFMSLAAVKAHFASHSTLSIACHVQGGLEYHDITVGQLVAEDGDHALVRFEAESRPVSAHSGGVTERFNAVSLLATDNHAMFVQMGRTTVNCRRPAASQGATQSESAAPFRLIDADAVVAAGSRDSSTVVRLTGQFERGLNSADSSVAAFPLSQALSLATRDQLLAFMALYGYWLGNGWLDGSKASVVLGPKKPKDEPYLDALLARLPLPRLQSAARGAPGFWKAADVSSEGQLQYHIVDPAWWQLFGEQYGHKHAGHSAAAALATAPLPLAEGVSSAAKCMWGWVWRRSKEQLRALIDGLAMADGHKSSCGGCIHTASARFRDELVRVLLHAGYSCTFAGSGEQGQTGGMSKGWSVHFTEDASTAQPTLTVCSEVSRLPSVWRGTVWCVTVPTAEHLIMVRRVLERDGDVVLRASRPVVVGNSATPKYGLIYHSTFIGRAGVKNRGRISRYLANKCSLASRIDSFSDGQVTSVFGVALRGQVEDRLEFYKTGVVPKKNVEVMTEAVVRDREKRAEEEEEKEERQAAGGAEEKSDVDMEAAAKEKKKKKKKDKKRQSEQQAEVEAPQPAAEEAMDVDGEAAASERREKKKKDKKRRLDAVVDAAPVAPSPPPPEVRPAKKEKKDKSKKLGKGGNA